MGIDIDNEKNEVKLNMNTEFYALDMIIEAAQEFTDSCWINIDREKEDKVIVIIKPKSKEIDINTVGNEFYNFVLGLMKNKD